jgi:hypothetical protein
MVQLTLARPMPSALALCLNLSDSDSVYRGGASLASVGAASFRA